VQAGSGRLGLRLVAVNRATETLARWSTSWQPYLPDMPTSTARIARFADGPDNRHRLVDAFDQHTRRQAEHAQPEHHALQQAAETAQQRRTQAWTEAADVREHYRARLDRYGSLAAIDNPDQRLDEIRHTITSTEHQLTATGQRLDRLTHEPAVQRQPVGWLDRAHQRWQTDDDADTATARQLVERHAASLRAARAAEALGLSHDGGYPTFGHDTGRQGPSFGR
jgi:hypothetical protein